VNRFFIYAFNDERNVFLAHLNRELYQKIRTRPNELWSPLLFYKRQNALPTMMHAVPTIVNLLGSHFFSSYCLGFRIQFFTTGVRKSPFGRNRTRVRKKIIGNKPNTVN
jgi:hypothetical protein